MPTFDFIDLLNILALFLCYLYAFQNWALKKNKTRANNYFTLVLLNLSVIILFFLLGNLGLDAPSKVLIPILLTATILMPPLLWVYLRKLIFPRNNSGNFKHFIFPFTYGGLVTLAFIIFYLAGKSPLGMIVFKFIMYGTIGGITVVFLSLNVIYIFLSFRLLKRHRENVANFYSYTEEVDMRWVQVLIYGYIFLVAGLVVCETLVDGIWSDFVFYGVLILYVAYTGHQSLRQKEIQLEDRILKTKSNGSESPIDEFEEESVEYQYTESQHLVFQELKEKLLVHIEAEKPYLDQELTIFKLAKELNTNTKYLSFIINKEFHQNFINFINEYRINEVKTKLVKQENQNYTIEALAQNAGFKSKSSFNAAFKRYTGKTPSIYMKEHSELLN